MCTYGTHKYYSTIQALRGYSCLTARSLTLQLFHKPVFFVSTEGKTNTLWNGDLAQPKKCAVGFGAVQSQREPASAA